MGMNILQKYASMCLTRRSIYKWYMLKSWQSIQSLIAYSMEYSLRSIIWYIWCQKYEYNFKDNQFYIEVVLYQA